MKSGLTISIIVDFIAGTGREICNQCEKKTTSAFWCQPCNSSRFKEEFTNWRSEDDNIDEFIREVQLNATSNEKVLEWIPYSKLKNLTPIGTGGFGKVYSAEWNEGYTLYWNTKDNKWKRKGEMKVALKYLIDSQNITKEFLNEIKSLHKLNEGVSRITRCYGITQHEETNNFMIVMQLIEDGNLRANISELRMMSWKEKLKSLYQIAEGLYQMHKAKLVHRDFHTGNILFSRIRNNAPYITDLGLCKPASEYTSKDNRKVYGVLPYVAPEVLHGEEYTKAADVYAFGVIMSEVISGIPPFHNVPHEKDLANEICNGKRPGIRSETPPLMVKLMQKCWDAELHNRLSSFDLRCILRAWKDYTNWTNSDLYNQIKESEKTSNSPGNAMHEKNSLAIYTSRLLDFENLSKPINSVDINYIDF